MNSADNLVMWLGAGFSVPAGLPMAAQLFDLQRMSPSRSARRHTLFALANWKKWKHAHPASTPEEFIAEVYANPETRKSGLWTSILRTLMYAAAEPFARFSPKGVPYSDSFVLNSRTCFEHWVWWGIIFSATNIGHRLTVVTTNWDILIERSLGLRENFYVSDASSTAPGFNYGVDREEVVFAEREWWLPPRFRPESAIDRTIGGSVPLLKLHGSLSWSDENGKLVKYANMRPAFNGTASIVPPIEHKLKPLWAHQIWDTAEAALSRAKMWIIVGASFPNYDHDIQSLIKRAWSADTVIHVFDIKAATVKSKLIGILPSASIHAHDGLPGGIPDLAEALQVPRTQLAALSKKVKGYRSLPQLKKLERNALHDV